MLVLLSVNVLAAGLFFIVALYGEHQITYNVKKGLSFLNFRNAKLIIYAGILTFTLVEVAGAGTWITLVDMGQPLQGLMILTISSLVEYTLTGAVARL